MIKLSKKYLTDAASPTLEDVVDDLYFHVFILEKCTIWLKYNEYDDHCYLEFQDDENGWFLRDWLPRYKVIELFKPENLKKYLDEHKE